MQYFVHTRRSIADIIPRTTYAIISIRTPHAPLLTWDLSGHCHGVLELAFDDLDRAGDPKQFPTLLTSGEARDPILFTEHLGDQILDFWQLHRGLGAMYVHCDAGYSRSPGVVAALQKIEGASDEFWFQTKRPNMLVYRTLLNRAAERGMLP